MKNVRLSATLVAVQFIAAGYLLLDGPAIARQPLLLALQLAGLLLGLWAVWVMRIGQFNIVPDPRAAGTLVQKGPYRRLRHPMYTALLSVVLASVLQNMTLLRSAIFLLLLANLVVKLRYEERLLSAHYPDYPQYMQQTSRLLPGIY